VTPAPATKPTGTAVSADKAAAIARAAAAAKERAAKRTAK
jgi:hypothetical protein